jgi:hypothetical protein
MFSQTRFSIGIGFGGHGFYQPPPSYPSNGYRNGQPFSSGYQVATRYDNRFNDGNDRQSITRGFEQDRNRGFGQGRNSIGQDRSDQTRGFTQGHARDFGQNQNQNQNRGNRNRSDYQDNREGNGYANGFRGR